MDMKKSGFKERGYTWLKSTASHTNIADSERKQHQLKQFGSAYN
ncbi:hypothetical protein [Acetobacter aceti]|nr:hypothetical protein [Acetobacter aceti]